MTDLAADPAPDLDAVPEPESNGKSDALAPTALKRILRAGNGYRHPASFLWLVDLDGVQWLVTRYFAIPSAPFAPLFAREGLPMEPGRYMLRVHLSFDPGVQRLQADATARFRDTLVSCPQGVRVEPLTLAGKYGPHLVLVRRMGQTCIVLPHAEDPAGVNTQHLALALPTWETDHLRGQVFFVRSEGSYRQVFLLDATGQTLGMFSWLRL